MDWDWYKFMLAMGGCSREPYGADMEMEACSNEPAVKTKAKLIVPDIREGDWNAYKKCISELPYQSSACRDNYGGVLAYRRRCALAYLGKRAQLYGGVCSRTQPRVLTPAFSAAASESNRVIRFKRYPWLGKLLDLLTEIERVQEEVGMSANVISLVSASKSE
jgi:hypothetical protein